MGEIQLKDICPFFYTDGEETYLYKEPHKQSCFSNWCVSSILGYWSGNFHLVLSRYRSCYNWTISKSTGCLHIICLLSENLPINTPLPFAKKKCKISNPKQLNHAKLLILEFQCLSSHLVLPRLLNRRFNLPLGRKKDRRIEATISHDLILFKITQYN